MRWVALAVAVAVAFNSGCNSSSQKSAKATPDYFQVDPGTAASVRGSVHFEGKRPTSKRISMDAEEICQDLQKSPVYDDLVLVGKEGGLANVFVYIKTGLEGKAFAPAQTAVVLDQRGCQFVPRVVALRAGQTLRVRNSDPVSHNIHPMPQNNRDWNQHQSPQAPDLQRRFAHPEVMIPVKCNVHNWMKSYIGVLDHPYFAVTGPSGEFSLENLPAGQYTLVAWHETLGERSQTVDLPARQSESVTFRFR